MAEKPIILRSDEVRAVLEGRQSQFRRVVKLRDRTGTYSTHDETGWPVTADECGEYHRDPCPYGAPGDRLRVRETVLLLTVTDVRVERLQDISDSDARAEGVDVIPQAPAALSHRTAFAGLWDSINGKPRADGVDISWNANPWVWAVSFERQTVSG